jgi:ubiquinone/menaquinone biosynthesis C-methylase UbiE
LATVDVSAERSKLPDYARRMAAYHRTFARELRSIIRSLPLRPGACVVDFACGDGSYTRWLARRLGPGGKVLAVDISPAFLELASRRTPNSSTYRGVGFVQADLNHLPLAEGSIDLAWCAQSLYSLSDAVEALRLMARAVKPGGHVAVFENDELHHVLLPWPVEIEMAVRKAELLSYVETSEKPRKYYVGRELRRAFRAAGLADCQVRSVAFTRQAPLDRPARSFFTRYLVDLRQRVRPNLESGVVEIFDRLADPGSEQFLLSNPDLAITCLNHVVIGTKEKASAGRVVS